jgi:hypothetical protein
MPKFTPNGLDTFIQHLPPASEGAAAKIVSISNAAAAVVTVALNEIKKFTNLDVVTIAGAPSDFAAANGAHAISAVDPILGTFVLTGVNTSAALAPTTATGMTATPQQGSAPAVNIMSMTNTKPVVVTVATAGIAYFKNGEVVLVEGTDTELDGRAFIAESVGAPANTVTLRGSDLSINNTTLTNKGTLQAVPDIDFDKFCLTNMEYEKAAADPIDVSTFCGTESLAGTPEPGTVSIEAFIDYKVTAYNEWREAVDDGRRRVWKVIIPAQGGGGTILYVLTPSGYTETFAIGEGASFSGEAVVNEKPLYLV